MTWRSLLFSFKGRISRRTFYLKGVPAQILLFFLWAGVAALPILGGSFVETDWGMGISATLMIVMTVLLVWVLSAVSAKRWHDLGKSGWWTLIALVPYLGILFAAYALGSKPEYEGPNQYGGTSF